MADSGNGEKAAVPIDVVRTVASSANSPRKDKRSTKSASGAKKPEQYGPAEALEFLESAIGYCRAAGLKVSYVNQKDDGRLVLFIKGAQYDDASTGNKFVPVLAEGAQ